MTRTGRLGMHIVDRRRRAYARAMPAASRTRKALILTADKFEDFELFVPLFRLLEAGWQVTVAAPTMDEIGGEHGYSIAPETTFDAVDAKAYELLLIPGGFPDGAPATVRRNKTAIAITRSFVTGNKVVAAICHGPWTLASADVVRGRHLTSFWHDGVPEDIKAAGGLWEDKEVVVDDNLITARWPMDLPAFTRALMKRVGA
jgi:protease I